MDVPPEVAFRHVKPTDELKRRILDGIDKLETVYGHLISCRVMVENTTPDRESGQVYRVRLDIGVPRHEVVVDQSPAEHGEPEDVSQILTEAFNIARRRLRELKNKQRGKVKTHDLPPHGRVVRLLANDEGVGYGFLTAADGRELYFHENAVVGGEFDDLEVGTEVRFAESRGDEGPQASTVTLLDRRNVGPRQDESIPLQTPHEE